MITILRTKGRLDGLRFALIGDMRLRTIHSLSYAMCQFDIEAAYASPPDMAMTDQLRRHLTERGVRFREFETAGEAIVDADVIYVESTIHPAMDKGHDAATGKEQPTPEAFRITQRLLYEKGKSDALVLHSLPRRDEISADVDPTRHCGYWVQASNGVLIRMALLALVLGAIE
jgi:aspartate carbamoyltransferase catalytic subunit